ncbi:MAG: 50S ribosomal protein L15 [Thermoflexus sp.]|uniref:50S ribosomal protein L15 n=1 Tax=Thermoflexus sp. TaxID=1969742 RepID=UPI00332C46D8
MKLHELKPAPGSKKERKRVGRGLGSGHGTYAGRGRKGQKSRSGDRKMPPYFEGGRTPLVRRLPKARGEGFTLVEKVVYQPVNVGQLTRFPPHSEVTPLTLAQAGLLRDPEEPVVILGDGELDRPLIVKAHRFSASARAKIEAAGGQAIVLARA